MPVRAFKRPRLRELRWCACQRSVPYWRQHAKLKYAFDRLPNNAHVSIALLAFT